MHDTKRDNRLLLNQNIKTIQNLSVSNENNLDKTDDNHVPSGLNNGQISDSENYCARGRLPWLQHDADGIKSTQLKETENHEEHDSECDKQDTHNGGKSCDDECDPLHIKDDKIINRKTDDKESPELEGDGFERLCVSVGVGTEDLPNLDWKDVKGTVRSENSRLRRQIEEVSHT